jgi:hypothetical protein
MALAQSNASAKAVVGSTKLSIDMVMLNALRDGGKPVPTITLASTTNAPTLTNTANAPSTPTKG